MSTTAKRFVVRNLAPIGARLFRLYFRYFPIRFGKARAWQFCQGHLGWRQDLSFDTVITHGIRMHMNLGGSVSNELFFWGTWEPGITSLMEALLKPGDTFIDIGGNIGYHSLLASKLVGPSGKVIALEPAPQIRQEFLSNVDMNPDVREAGNITVLPYCVFDKDSEVVLNVFTQGNTGMSSIRDLGSGSVAVTVPARRLDDILADYDLSRCTMMKIDIEGAEYRAILGMERILRENPAITLIVEVLPDILRQAGDSAEALFDTMRNSGYRAFLIDAPRLNIEKIPVSLRPIGGVPEIVEQLATHAECNVLFTKSPAAVARFTA